MLAAEAVLCCSAFLTSGNLDTVVVRLLGFDTVVQFAGSSASEFVYIPVLKSLAVSNNARQGISSWISSVGATVEPRDRKSGKWCDAPCL